MHHKKTPVNTDLLRPKKKKKKEKRSAKERMNHCSIAKAKKQI